MRLLITILLLPIFCNAQMSMGVANYSTEYGIKWSVLANGSFTNAQRAQITHDSLGCNYVRSQATINTWTGTVGQIDSYIDSGLVPIININYAAQDPAAPIPNLSTYGDTIRLIMSKYAASADMVYVLENEEYNTNFHAYNLATYLQMADTAAAIIHKYGKRISDGGIYGDGLDCACYRWLKDTGYNATVADSFAVHSMTSAVQTACGAKSSPSLETLVAQIDTILNSGIFDYYNLHLYEVYDPNIASDTDQTVATQYVYRYITEFVNARTHKPVLSNEIGQRHNIQPNLVSSYLAQWYGLGVYRISWYSGTGAAGAQPLTDTTTGVVQPNGLSFKTYVKAHQSR